MLSDKIIQQINRVRRIIRGLFILDGFCRLFIAIAIFVIITFCIDRVINLLNSDLPSGVRLFFLGILVVVVIYIIYNSIIYPLRRRITDDDIAICVERLNPNLSDRLISSVQLSRFLESSSHEKNIITSRELIQNLIKETNELVATYDFRKIIDPTVQKKLLGLLVGLILIIGTFISFYPLYASIWFNRILGGSANWPKRTQLMVMLDRQIVAQGENITIKVKALKGIPPKAVIHYKFESGEKGNSRMDKLGRDLFKFDFLKVCSSLEFFVIGGDDKTDTYQIKVLPPPRLNEIKCWYEYPTYTKLPPTPIDKPEKGGMIQAPIGTVVKFTAICNLPLQSAQLKIGESNPIPLQVGRDTVTNEPIASGSLKVEAEESIYSLFFTAENGLSNIELIQYPIKGIPDKAPLVKIITPRVDNKQVTAEAKIPIKVETSDDYGISHIALSYNFATLESGQEARPERINFTRRDNNADYDSPRIETNYLFDMGRLKVKEGDIIRWLIEVEDNCTIPQPHKTTSREYRFTVISRAQLEKKLEAMIMQIKEKVKEIQQFQIAQAKQTSENINIEVFGDKPQLSTAEEQALQRGLSNQRRITQSLEDCSRELDTIIEDIIINNLWDSSTRERLNNINEALKKIASEKSPRACDFLAQALYAIKPVERKEKLSLALAVQNEIIKALTEVLNKMAEWEDYQEVIRLTREILLLEEKILNQLQNK